MCVWERGWIRSCTVDVSNVYRTSHSGAELSRQPGNGRELCEEGEAYAG